MNLIRSEPPHLRCSASSQWTLPGTEELDKWRADAHPAGSPEYYKNAMDQMARTTFSELANQSTISESYSALRTGSENNSIPDQGPLETNYKSSPPPITSKEICACNEAGDVYFNDHQGTEPGESVVTHRQATAASSEERAFGIIKLCPDHAMGYPWVDPETRGEAQSLASELQPQCDTKEEGREEKNSTQTTFDHSALDPECCQQPTTTVTDQEPPRANHESIPSPNTEVKRRKTRYTNAQIDFIRSASKNKGMDLSFFTIKFNEKFHDEAPRTESALKHIFYRYKKAASSDPSVSSIARPCPERAACDESFDDGIKDAMQGLATELQPQCDTKEEGREEKNSTPTTFDQGAEARRSPVHFKPEHADFVLYNRVDMGYDWRTIIEVFHERFRTEPKRTIKSLQYCLHTLNKKIPVCDEDGYLCFDNEEDVEPRTINIYKRQDKSMKRWGIAKRYPVEAVRYDWVDDGTKILAEDWATKRQRQYDTRKEQKRRNEAENLKKCTNWNESS